MLVNQAFNNETTTTTILNLDTMSLYPNILTPPSTNDDNFMPTPIFVSPAYFPTFAQQHVPREDDGPYLKIVEQPVDRFRFRYKSEMTGTHGSLNGWSSDRTRKQTFPTVELVGYNKPAIIRCSLYQYNAKEDNMPHAHRLVKRYGSKAEQDDPHDIIVSQETGGFQAVFHSMGIIHTAKKNIIPELVRKKRLLKKEEVARKEGKLRTLTTKEEMEIKKAAENESKTINLNTVCLRFDAFLKSDEDILYPICKPIFTHGINNLKSALTGELKIVRMDHVSSPAKGGKEIFMLVERVTKKNIKIRFYQLDDDEENVLWDDYGRFTELDVHHQYAIVFKTPPYKDNNITKPVKVYVELERSTDKATSDPKEFTYVPNANMYEPGSKRPRVEEMEVVPTANDLPVTIDDLNLDNSAELGVTSTELAEALNNIDSDEFQKVYDSFKDEYGLLTQDSALQKMILKQNAAQKISQIFSSGGAPDEQSSRTTILKNVTISEQALAKRTDDELRGFMKTKPNNANTIKMIKYWLGEENKTNGLHINIRMGDENATTFLLNLIYFVKQYDIVNIKSSEGYTPLHLAIISRNEKLISNLIFCKAKINEVDPFLNTALHLAVSWNVSPETMDKLTSVENIKHFINEENEDGDTPLNLAIDSKNVPLFEILIKRGSDVNKKHKKDGYTPLRSAIEKQMPEMVKHLLKHRKIDPFIEDFKRINPLQVAKQQENQEIVEIVNEYMKEHNCDHLDLKIKSESDVESTEEEAIGKLPIKIEPITHEELMEMYENVEYFTPDCLEKISEMLDKSGSWEKLAEILELDQLFESNLWEPSESPSKFILNFAIEGNGDSILKIRNLLKDLNEMEVVERIDTMVKTVVNS